VQSGVVCSAVASDAHRSFLHAPNRRASIIRELLSVSVTHDVVVRLYFGSQGAGKQRGVGIDLLSCHAQISPAPHLKSSCSD